MLETQKKELKERENLMKANSLISKFSYLWCIFWGLSALLVGQAYCGGFKWELPKATAPQTKQPATSGGFKWGTSKATAPQTKQVPSQVKRQVPQNVKIQQTATTNRTARQYPARQTSQTKQNQRSVNHSQNSQLCGMASSGNGMAGLSIVSNGIDCRQHGFSDEQNRRIQQFGREQDNIAKSIVAPVR